MLLAIGWNVVCYILVHRLFPWGFLLRLRDQAFSLRTQGEAAAASTTRGDANDGRQK